LIIDNCCATKYSFIFSFKNNDKIEDYVLSCVVDENKAVYSSPTCGPSFGESDLDIWAWSENKCCCEKSSYEKPIRENNDFFLIEECEVFQIVKN